MAERGQVNNRSAAEQGRDLTGLCIVNMSPSDIDGVFMEIRDECYVFLEAKVEGTGLDAYGQRTAFRRLVDKVEKGGAISIGIVFNHTDRPPDQINYAKGIVKECRFKGEWWPETKGRNVKDFLNDFFKKYYPRCEIS